MIVERAVPDNTIRMDSFRVMRRSLFSTASLYLDFSTNYGFAASIPSSASSLLTTTRASTGYADTLSGTYLPFLSDIPRITDKGLLVEEARTNSIRNNSMQGAVAGTPGTAPTNWLVSGTGLTRTVVGFGTVGEIDYIDLRLVGSSVTIIDPEGASITVASSGQTWTASSFVAVVGGSLANITALDILVLGNTAAGAFVEGTAVSILGVTSGLNRFTVSRALNNASTERVSPRISLTPSGAFDITLRIGWPQLELGAFVTSPIRTTSAAATRAADLVTLTTVPVSGGTWTAFVDATSPTTAGKSTYFLAAGNNDFIIYSSTAAQTRVSAFNGTPALNATAGSGNWSTGIKAAVSADGSGRSAVGNNGTVGTDTNTQTFPAALAIGSRSVSTTEGVITTRRIALWPVRLANAQMQALTA